MNWIIVTGDSGTLGHNITKYLLSKNYGVIGISRSTNNLINELLLKHPDHYIHINFDLSDTEKIKELYLSKIKDVGNIQGLVNNSAFGYDDLATNAKLDNLVHMFNVNLIAPIMLTKYTIRDMLLKNIEGSIIHISSVSTKSGYKGLSMYASSKGGLEAFSKNIAREWGPRGIRSNCVSPGFMETNMTSNLSTEQKNRIYNRTSLKKQTNIDSVTSTICFLLTEASKSITGEVIYVDNGT